MADEIKRLIELQQLDGEIFRIKGELEAMPEKLKEFSAIIKEKESIYTTSEEKSKKLKVQQKEKEIELQTKEEAIKKHQTQLYQLKTNKEYTAMEKEIASLKADNSILEEGIIKLLDETDAVEKEITENKKIYEQEKSRIESEKKKVEQEKIQFETELKNIESQRSEFVKNIDKDILSKYERILQAKDGLALVPVVLDACDGCNMNLPPQVINEVKLKNDLIFCGNCSRILYSKD